MTKRLLMIAFIVFAASGWYVTTYSGEAMAGPFGDLSECTRVAKIMAKSNTQVQTICTVWR